MDRAELGRELRSLTVECDGGTASGLAAHFDVTPGDPVIPAGADGFHGGFLGGEARGISFDTVGLRFAVADFGLGENPAQEAVTEARDGRFNARNLRYIDTGADNHAENLLIRRSWTNALL